MLTFWHKMREEQIWNIRRADAICGDNLRDNGLGSACKRIGSLKQAAASGLA